MRLTILLILFITRCAPTFAQIVNSSSNQIVSDSIFANEAIARLSKHFNARIYYDQSRLDTVKVLSVFEINELKSTLDDVFGAYDFSTYRYDSTRYFLLHNTVIIDELPLINSYYKIDYDSTRVEKGMLFSKEIYSEESPRDVENRINEVGQKSLMRVGNQALLAGHLYENEKKEPLVGALVYDKKSMTSTTTDSEGFYSLSLPVGKHDIVYQYSGLKTGHRKVVLYSNGKLDVSLEMDVVALHEVVIKADKNKNLDQVSMGLTRIEVEETKNVPLVLGEKDIIKIATTTPGIQTQGEGASGFNVRGGKSDQNLMMLNGTTIYNPNHFFGFFSAFNADAIESMDVYKSSIPAQYGGRLSSVFNIEGKKAASDSYHLTGGISPVTSRLSLEAPIIKDKLAVVLGGRTTYSDWVLKQIDDDRISQNKLSFYDVIAAIDYNHSARSKFKLTYYHSDDKFKLKSDSLFSFSDFTYKNDNLSLLWNQLVKPNFGFDVSLSKSAYDWEIAYDASVPNSFIQEFHIRELNSKVDAWFDPNDAHRLTFGMSSVLYEIQPGSKSPFLEGSTVKSIDVQDEKGLESAIYVSNEHKISHRLSLVYGGRLVLFNSFGPHVVYGYQPYEPKNDGTRSDTTYYNGNQISESYLSPELRLGARFKLTESSSVKMSYDRLSQFIQAISNAASISPTDTWRLSSQHILPQFSDQFSIGYYKTLTNSKLDISIESYCKRIQNLIDFKAGSSLSLNEYIETELLQGAGRSYGLEFSVTKEGRLNGWVNYTYARSLIQLNSEFEEEKINEGHYYPTNYDKPHTINLVANYKLTRRFSVSTNFNYTSGRPITYPESFYEINGLINLNYSDRNAFRIPHYMRVDLGINIEGNHKVKKLAHSFWTVSVYNLLGRRNPYSIYFNVKDGEVNGYQLSVFPTPIPTLTYNFKF